MFIRVILREFTKAKPLYFLADITYSSSDSSTSKWPVSGRFRLSTLHLNAVGTLSVTVKECHRLIHVYIFDLSFNKGASLS